MICEKCDASWIEYHDCENPKIGLCPVCNPEVFLFSRMTVPTGYIWCCDSKQLVKILPRGMRLESPPLPVREKPVLLSKVPKILKLVHNPELDGIITSLITNEPAWSDYCNGKESAVGNLVGILKKKIKIAPAEIKARIERIRLENRSNCP